MSCALLRSRIQGGVRRRLVGGGIPHSAPVLGQRFSSLSSSVSSFPSHPPSVWRGRQSSSPFLRNDDLLFHQQRRTGGMERRRTFFTWARDKITSKMMSKQEAKSEEFQKEFFRSLWKTRKLTIGFFVDHLAARAKLLDLDGWKKHLPGADTEIVLQLKAVLDLAAQIPKELHGFEEFDGKAKKLIMEQSGTNQDTLRTLVSEYDQIRMIHLLFQFERRENGKVPEKQEDLTALFARHNHKIASHRQGKRLLAQITGINPRKGAMKNLARR